MEEKVATMDPSTSTDTGIPGLSSNQHVANASIGWKVALRQMLLVVFGTEILARSC